MSIELNIKDKLNLSDVDLVAPEMVVKECVSQLEEINHYANVLQTPQRAYQSAYRQSFYVVASFWYACHLHPAVGTDEEYFSLGVFCPQGVCYTDGREDMTSRASSAYDYSHG